MSEYIKFKIKRTLKKGPKYIIKKLIIKKHANKIKVQRNKRYAYSLKIGRYIESEYIDSLIGNSFQQKISSIFSDTNSIREALKEIPIAHTKKILQYADLWVLDKPILLETKYDINIKKKNGHYPWNEDFINGARYPEEFYTELKIGKNINCGDIKIPWELSRMHGLVTLAQAYIISNKPEYIDKIKFIVNDFNQLNPCGYGVNWMYSMEVGIRIINILAAYALIQQELSSNDELHDVIKRMAIEHGLFINDNLEATGRVQSNNHYIANLLGLLFISISYPETKISTKWRDFSVKELNYEIKKHIYPDGLSFEGSISYGRLTAEMFYFARVLMRKANLLITKTYDERLLAISNSIKWLTAQNGCVPQVGDNDSGRIFILRYRNPQDFTYLSGLIDYELCSAQNRKCCLNSSFEAIWIYGKVLHQKHENGIKFGLYKFEYGNHVIYKNKDVYILFSAYDPYKNDVPGHMHNDKLSFVLQYKGKDFFVDPGTGTYTGNIQIRNMLRSVSSHNTVQIDSKEQNRFGNTAFSYFHDGTAKVDFNETNDEVRIFGENDCYKQRLGIIHHRTLSIIRENIIINDRYYKVDNDKDYDVRTYFVLHPNVVIESCTENEITLTNEEVSIKFIYNGEALIEDTLYSPKYNSWLNTKKIMIISKTSSSSEMKVILSE